MAGFLRRYTNAMSLIDMVMKRTITLLPTTTWVDRNDRRAIEIYKAKTGTAGVVALCLAEASETFHHWRIFTGGDSGVCIEFDKDAFVELFPDGSNFRHGPVRYMKMRDLQKATNIGLSDLPFLKRRGFSAEKEYRVIGTTNAEVDTLSVPVDLAIVRKVTFSPFMNPVLAKSVRKLICTIPDCASLRWGQSKLIESQSWLKAIDRLTD